MLKTSKIEITTYYCAICHIPEPAKMWDSFANSCEMTYFFWRRHMDILEAIQKSHRSTDGIISVSKTRAVYTGERDSWFGYSSSERRMITGSEWERAVSAAVIRSER